MGGRFPSTPATRRFVDPRGWVGDLGTVAKCDSVDFAWTSRVGLATDYHGQSAISWRTQVATPRAEARQSRLAAREPPTISRRFMDWHALVATRPFVPLAPPQPRSRSRSWMGWCVSVPSSSVTATSTARGVKITGRVAARGAVSWRIAVRIPRQ